MTTSSITLDQQYETVNGYAVKIFSVCANGPFPVIGVIQHSQRDVAQQWTIHGIAEDDDRLNLIVASPYRTWKIDDLVWFFEPIHNKWIRRHFAGVNRNGKPTVFPFGYTSQSALHASEYEVAEPVQHANEFTPDQADEDLTGVLALRTLVAVDKRYTTRSGLLVTILKINARGRFPVVGIVHEEDGDYPKSWTRYGTFFIEEENQLDLVELTEPAIK